MECENFLTGAVAVLLLGRGNLGLSSEKEEHHTPILFGWDEWLSDQGISDLSLFFHENKTAIADALASVRIGRRRDRLAEAAATKYMSAEGAERYRAEIHDRRRSSLNDIGNRAWQLAKRLRGDQEVKIVPEGTIVVGTL